MSVCFLFTLYGALCHEKLESLHFSLSKFKHAKNLSNRFLICLGGITSRLTSEYWSIFIFASRWGFYQYSHRPGMRTVKYCRTYNSFLGAWNDSVSITTIVIQLFLAFSLLVSFHELSDCSFLTVGGVGSGGICWGFIAKKVAPKSEIWFVRGPQI